MKKQVMSAFLCAMVVVPAAQAMLGNGTLGNVKPTSFRRADIANKVAERRDLGPRPTPFRQAASVSQPTVTSRQVPDAGLNRQVLIRRETAPLNTVETTSTVAPAAVPAATPTTANKVGLGQVQQGFSSVSSAPAYSSIVPEAGSAKISEGLSSASTFQGLKQTTGRTAPAAAQNVMQSAPAQRLKGFFNR